MDDEASDLLKVATREAQRALGEKNAGNVLFRAQDWRGAHRHYTRGLYLAPPLRDVRRSLPELAETRVALLANRAAACLGQKWYVCAVLDASSAIAEALAAHAASPFAIIVDSVMNEPARSSPLGKLLGKARVRRARAYEGLGLMGRAEADHRAARKKAPPQPEPEPPAAGADAGPLWSAREDWFQQVEAYLGASDLGRLRRVNKAWKTGVESHEEAWSAAEQAALGSLAIVQPHALGRVPVMLEVLLRRPPPLVIDIGTGFVKAGFAGQPGPIVMSPNFSIQSGRGIINCPSHLSSRLGSKLTRSLLLRSRRLRPRDAGRPCRRRRIHHGLRHTAAGLPPRGGVRTAACGSGPPPGDPREVDVQPDQG